MFLLYLCLIVFVSVCQSVFVCNYWPFCLWRINLIINSNLIVRISYPFRDWRILLESSLFPHLTLVVYTSLKSTFCGLQLRRRHYGSIFIRLAVVASQNREITWNSYKSWHYGMQFKVIHGHRSWCQSRAHCDFLFVINSKFGYICCRFRDIDA